MWSNSCGNSSTKKKIIKVKGWRKVPVLDKEQRMKYIHVMKQAPLYPSDKKVYICNIHFADDCFQRDLNVHVVVTISRNSRFCLFIFKQPPEVLCKKKCS